MKLLDISLDDIDLTDERFRISFHFDLEKLRISIKKIGLVCPLVVVKRNDPRFVILSGWKRAFSFQELSLPSVPVFLLEEDDDYRAFLFSLYENLAVRNFNILEKAEIVRKLHGYVDNEREIVKTFFPLLEIPANLSYLDMYLKIARLDSACKKMIFDKKMPLPQVQLLTEFSPQDRERILPLILPLGQNKLKQFLEDLFELTRKTGNSAAAILSAPEIQAVSESDNLSLLQKADRIRALLRTHRYPTLTSWKKSFDASLRKARLSKDVAFDAPSFFEDGEFSVTFSVKSKKAFQERLARLQDLASDENLFSIYKKFFDG